MSKKKASEQASKKDPYLEQVRADFKEINPSKEDREAVWQAFIDLKNKGYKTDVINKVVKQETGTGFSVKKLKQVKGEQAPAGVEKTLERVVTTEIAREAAAELRAVLQTGKSLEDAMGPLARFYGFESTAVFVTEMFTFWDTWHKHIQTVVAERDMFKWAIRELTEKLSPEARKVLKDEAVKEVTMATIVMGQQTGNFPPPETMRGYIKVLKEEMV